MLSSNILIFTSVAAIFVLLFFTTFLKKPSSLILQPSVAAYRIPYQQSSSVPLFSMSSPFPLFFTGTEEDEKQIDADEKKFISDYNSKNKDITLLKNSLNVCNNNRNKINEAIQQLRVDTTTDINNAYTIAKKNSADCENALDTRIPKYIAAYNKKYGKTLTTQQVVNKIATGQLLFE